MSAGSLMWVWWGPPPPVPFPLVLISQVDEHISSSPNPSPRIPPHMSTMHTNRHTCVNTAHVRESRVTWCTGPQWKSNNNKKKCCLKRSTVSLFIHSWNEEKEAMTRTCTYTHCDESDIYQPGFKSSQIILHFVSALTLHFTSIPLDTHCSPPIYRSFHVTDCCW